MQFKVPQNIDLEDKIIGSLTLVQFIYLMAGGMVFYVTLKIGKTPLMLFVGLPVALFALMLAFLKIQDQPFLSFVSSFILYIARPKKRIWAKELQLEQLPEREKTEIKKEVKTIKRSPQTEDINSLVNILDTGGETPEKTENPYEKM